MAIWRSVKARFFKAGHIIADDRNTLAVEIAGPLEKLRNGNVAGLTFGCATREERRREQHANVTSAPHAPNETEISHRWRGRA